MLTPPNSRGKPRAKVGAIISMAKYCYTSQHEMSPAISLKIQGGWPHVSRPCMLIVCHILPRASHCKHPPAAIGSSISIALLLFKLYWDDLTCASGLLGALCHCWIKVYCACCFSITPFKLTKSRNFNCYIVPWYLIRRNAIPRTGYFESPFGSQN